MRRTVSVEKLGHDPYFSDQENILLWAAVVEKKHCLFDYTTKTNLLISTFLNHWRITVHNRKTNTKFET